MLEKRWEHSLRLGPFPCGLLAVPAVPRWSSRIVEQAKLSEEEAESVLEVLAEDLAAALRQRRGRPRAVGGPPYFDRYVTAEISRVSGQISDLREEVNRGFDRIDRWFLSVGVPLILGILAIIVTIFFGP